MNNPLSLTPTALLYLRPLTKIFFSLLIASLFYYLSLPNFESPWLLWSALLFSLLHYGDRLLTRLLAIVICVLCTLVAVVLSIIFSYQPLIWAVYLFLITLVCVYFGNKYPKFFTAALIINLFAIVSGGIETDLEYSVFRCLFIFGGAVIALVAELLFWPRFVARRRFETARTMQRLKKLNALHFSCLGCHPARLLARDPESFQSNYPESKDTYEGRIYNLKYTLCSHSNPLIALTEVVIDLGAIRYQISDHTTFNLCARELEDILRAMNNMFENTSDEALQKYSAAIESLEDLYQGVLVQVAKEPLFFQLFIYKLKLFGKECERLRE